MRAVAVEFHREHYSTTWDLLWRQQSHVKHRIKDISVGPAHSWRELDAAGHRVCHGRSLMCQSESAAMMCIPF